jgi:cell division protein FtsB
VRRALAVVLAVVVGGGLAVFGGTAVVRVRALQAQITTLEHDVAGMREQARRLAETVDRLRNDPAYIEKLAREEHGLVRENETVLKFPSTKGK